MGKKMGRTREVMGGDGEDTARTAVRVNDQV
jgi:hypothetical protein